MTTFSSRPYAGEADLPSIVELINVAESADSTGKTTSVDEKRHEFDDPWIDSAHNLRLWHAGDQIVGFGELYAFEPAEVVQGRLFLYVHPQARTTDIGTDIIAWAEQRVREMAKGHALPVKLRVTIGDTDVYRQAVLEQNGLHIERYALDMARPFGAPLPDAPLPDGFTLRVCTMNDAEAWTAMYNESFVDHWNFRPWTPERFLHWYSDPGCDPTMCLVAVAPDGTFAAFCWAAIFADENDRSGRNDGHIDLLGTRRGFRRLGLGRAMLVAGLRRLAERGVDTAKLDVDASSPTGANRLYESVGFRTTLTWVRYVKDVAG